MHFTTSFAATVLALTAAAAGAPLDTPQNTLQEWQVSVLNWHSPSGRPGSYPWKTITANITDPNTINLGSSSSDGTNITVPAGSQGLNCQAEWFRDESPLGRTWPCDPTDIGYWVMNVLEGSDGLTTQDFNLKFTRVVDILYQGSQYKTTYEGTGNFGVGKNLATVCGGSGVCNYSLKEGSAPVLIAPQKV